MVPTDKQRPDEDTVVPTDKQRPDEDTVVPTDKQIPDEDTVVPTDKQRPDEDRQWYRQTNRDQMKTDSGTDRQTKTR